MNFQRDSLVQIQPLLPYTNPWPLQCGLQSLGLILAVQDLSHKDL